MTLIVIWWGLMAGVLVGASAGALTEWAVEEKEGLQAAAGFAAGGLALLAVAVPLLPRALRIGLTLTEAGIDVINLSGKRRLPWDGVVGLDGDLLYIFPRGLPVLAIRTNPRNIWENTQVHATIGMKRPEETEVGQALIAEFERRDQKLEGIVHSEKRT